MDQQYWNSVIERYKTSGQFQEDFCKSENASYIIRGLRNSTDFTYEQSIAQANYRLAEIESVFLICSPEISFISSTIVRDVIRNGGDYTKMVPRSVFL